MTSSTPTVRTRGHDRRRYRRARPGWRAAIGFVDDSDLVPATVEDVSIGGACLATRLCAAPGASVVVVLNAGKGIVAALATVMASAEGSAADRLRVGFVWLSEVNRARIAEATSAP